MPALSFPNARQAEGTLVDELTLTRILKNGEPLADSTQNAVEALIYEGIDSRNSVSQILSHTPLSQMHYGPDLSN